MGAMQAAMFGVRLTCRPRLRGYGTHQRASCGFGFRLLQHVGPQHRVHAPLIAIAFALEEIEHVFVDADGDGFLLAGMTSDTFGPVDIDRVPASGSLATAFAMSFVGQRVETRPVSLSLAAIVPSVCVTICLFLHLSLRMARRDDPDQFDFACEIRPTIDLPSDCPRRDPSLLVLIGPTCEE